MAKLPALVARKQVVLLLLLFLLLEMRLCLICSSQLLLEFLFIVDGTAVHICLSPLLFLVFSLLQAGHRILEKEHRQIRVFVASFRISDFLFPDGVSSSSAVRADKSGLTLPVQSAFSIVLLRGSSCY